MSPLTVILGVLILAGLAPAQQSQEPIEGTGWTFFRNIDKMTDADASYIASGVTDGIRQAAVAIACKPGIFVGDVEGYRVLYLYGGYLAGESGDVYVYYRLGNRPPEGRERWKQIGRAASQKDAATMPDRFVRAFIQQALQESKLVLRVVDPPDGETFEDEFAIHGLETALTRLPCKAQE